MGNKCMRSDRSVSKSDGRNSQNSVSTTETGLKAPTSLRDQVLVGMMNDVFSTCVFRSLPKINSNPVPLVTSKFEPPKISYMLSLKWTKSKILVQSISHPFSAYEGESNLSQDDTSFFGEKGELITTGLFNALKLRTNEPMDGSKIPVSILKNFINREINRGGYWAYMSSPVFLNFNESENVDEIKIQEGRRDKLLQYAEEELVYIRPTTILCLLWSIYYTNSHGKLKELCTALCYEFLENYHEDHQYLIYLLYLSQRMGILPNDQVEKMINAKFNNLTALENLSLMDVSILINIPDYFKGFTTIAQKVSTLVYHHIDDMNKDTAVYILTGLLRINFNFAQNIIFTRKLMSRIMSLYDSIASEELLRLLFNTMSILPYDIVGYFNELLSKTLNRLHKFTIGQTTNIACSYAIANNTSEILSELSGSDEEASQEVREKLQGNFEKYQASNIYHWLLFKLRKEAFQYRTAESDLLRSIHESIIYNMGFQFSEDLNKGNFEYGDEWFYNYSKNISIINMSKNTKKINAKALEDEANNPSYSKSYKLFFLNLIDDCFNNTNLWNESLISKILFSMLTLKIDISPINEAMLITKGELIKKAGGIITIKTIESEKETKNQYKMAKEIISWCRQNDVKNGTVGTSEVTLDNEPLEIFEIDNVKEEMIEEKLISEKQEMNEVIDEKKIDEVKKEPESQNIIKVKEPEEISIKNKEEEEEKEAKIEINGENKEEERLKEEVKVKEVEIDKNKKKANKLTKEELMELIKIAVKLPKSSLVEGNPIYDLLKSQSFENIEKVNGTEETTSDSPRLPEEESDTNFTNSLPKYKNGTKSLRTKQSKEPSESEGWVDIEKEDKKLPKKGHSKTGEKKVSKVNRIKEEVVFRVKQRVKAKMELEKREVEISYKYVKIRK